MPIIDMINAKNIDLSRIKKAIDYAKKDKGNKDIKEEILKTYEHIKGTEKYNELLAKLALCEINTNEKMENAIYYTDKESKGFAGGFNCNPNTAYEEFLLTKRHYKKETGRQYIHFVQSYSPNDNITPQKALEIADKLLNTFNYFKGFQVVYGVHTDKEHMHTHFVVNTVNSETGLKWKFSKKHLQALKDLSDEIAKEYELSIIPKTNKGYKKRGEFRAIKEMKSWKHELELSVKNAVKYSKSKDEFINNLSELGYLVTWEDNRKYITFISKKNSKHRLRLNSIVEFANYDKDKLLKQFEVNKTIGTNDIAPILTAIDQHKDTEFPLSHLEIEEEKTGIDIDFINSLDDIEVELLDETTTLYEKYYSEIIQMDIIKHELYYVFNNIKDIATSINEFNKMLEICNYQLDWNTKDEFIKIITPNNKVISSKIIFSNKNFTKEKLIEKFNENENIVNMYQNAEIQKNIETQNAIKILNRAKAFNFIYSILKVFRLNNYLSNPKNQLSKSEGQAIKDYLEELKKGQGFSAENEM